jgi:hypothetical protein
MTNRYAELAARILVHSDDKPSVRALGDRSAIVAAMRGALVMRSARLRRRYWALRAFVAVSAAAVTVVGLRWAVRRGYESTPQDAPTEIAIVAHPIGGGATMQGTTPGGVSRGRPDRGSDSSGVRLADGASLVPGSRIVSSRDGRVDLAFSTGTGILVEEGSDFALDEQTATQLFRLERGAVNAEVAPLRPGERFVLRTPDADIEVHGTMFRVGVVPADPKCGAGTRTRVRVRSGRVAVRTPSVTEILGPGQSWPAGCESTIGKGRELLAPPSIDVTDGIAPIALDAGAPVPAATVPLRQEQAPTPPAPQRASLAEINNRYAEAMAAKQSGRPTQALEILERIQAAHPSSPLAETIVVEQIRLLRAIDRARAAKLAARYLDRYPNGFARLEAESVRASVP